MNPDELKPNSHKYKEEVEEKKVEKIVSGKAITKKKHGGRRFADVFLSEDIGDVKDYLFFDVIVPAVKDAIVDTIQKAAEMMFYGRVKSRSKSRGSASYVSYSSYSKPNAVTPKHSIRRSFDDVILETREDAQSVIDILEDLLERYEKVTVGDLYDAAGITGNGYTDRLYGWTSLEDVKVVRVREGYLLDMPKPSEF